MPDQLHAFRCVNPSKNSPTAGRLSERNRISESNHVTWSNSRLISQPRRVRGARPW